MTDSSINIPALVGRMIEFTPHVAELGVCFDQLEGERLTLRLPWRGEFIGNPATGTIHEGVVVMLMENTLGIATLCSSRLPPTLNPTLDLRVDHLGSSSTNRDIMVTAWVTEASSKVVFIEGIAWCESIDKPIARATGSSVVMPEFDVQKLLQLIDK